ncbi:MAG: cytochrome b5-like heme/steroid binding domain-containing protein, partial [bacterium]|nr:cytochrome b5-like heme/steroid binding domain-containing protein [bacterium]
KHSRASDCWLLIGGKIYDVSGFLDLHPGGAETIIPYCGKEATRAFETEDKKNPQPHSLTAQNLLTDYYLGDLGR